jgi:hypothetical protein
VSANWHGKLLWHLPRQPALTPPRLWVSIGISGAVSGSIRAAASTRSALIPPTRAPSIAPIFPPTFYRLEPMNAVSESVSESIERVVKNCGGLKRIVIDFTGVFAILLALNRMFQVAERRIEINFRLSRRDELWSLPRV